jgi:hypothetical protein
MGLFDQIGVDSSIYMLAYQVGLHLRVVGGFCFSVLPVSSVRILARLMLEQWGFGVSLVSASFSFQWF